MTVEERQIEFERPVYYAKQFDAVFDKRRYSVIEASTKAGKTSACIGWLLERSLESKPRQNFWWVAPVSDQALIAFTRMQRSLPRGTFVAHLNLHTITLFNGAVIWFKSGDRADSLYGEDVFACVVDEASRFKQDAWHAIRTTLTATRGPIRIIGNVRGRKNWFYALARRAEHGDPDMGYHRLIAADAVAAGVLDAAEIEDARRLLPDRVFRELYLAEASDDEATRSASMRSGPALLRCRASRRRSGVGTSRSLTTGRSGSRSTSRGAAAGSSGSRCPGRRPWRGWRG